VAKTRSASAEGAPSEVSRCHQALLLVPVFPARSAGPLLAWLGQRGTPVAAAPLRGGWSRFEQGGKVRRAATRTVAAADT